MQKLTVKEVEELLNRETSIIKELAEKEKDYEYGWKKRKIQELKETIHMRIDAGILNIQKKDIASYIRHKLNDNEVKVNEGYFYSLFKSDEKHGDEGTNFLTTDPYLHVWKVIFKSPDYVLETCSHCNCKRINGINYEPETLPEKSDTMSEKKTDYENEFSPLIKRISDNCIELSQLWGSIYHTMTKPLCNPDDNEEKLQRENLCVEIKSILLEQKPLKEWEKEMDELEALYEFYGSITDLREKLHLGELCRVMLLSYDSNFAHVADFIDISAKWVKNIRDRFKEGGEKEDKRLRGWIEKLHSCPACGFKKYTYYLNLNVEREKKGLEAVMPELATPLCITCKKSIS